MVALKLLRKDLIYKNEYQLKHSNWMKQETIVSHIFVSSKKLQMFFYIYKVKGISLGNQKDDLWAHREGLND